MPYYKRFYPAPSASKAIRKDAKEANRILENLEDAEQFDNAPEWLKELEAPNPSGVEPVSTKRIEKLKILVTKLKVAGVGLEEKDASFDSITDALKAAYPPRVLSNLFENDSPFRKGHW